MAYSASPLAIGEIVGGYEILGIAGAGGMGVVYRARDRKLERTVALKFLPLEFDASETEKQRFLREARTASSLDHSNIGVIHGVEETPDGRTFIVMAFYEGSSLAQQVRRGAIPYRKAVEIAIEIVCGLQEAHSRQIVHRDIKSSNIMLTSSGSVKIVDFGLAHIMSAQTASQTGISGTVSYMSPEQSLGKIVDQRTDIWALGVVLAEMITGQNPFERATMSATLMAILNEAPRLGETVPLGLQHVIYRALAKEPQSRYQRCSDLLTDLNALLPQLADEEPASKAPLSRHSKASGEIRSAIKEASRPSWTSPARPKRQWIPWAIGTVALLLVAGTGVFLLPTNEAGSRLARLMKIAGSGDVARSTGGSVNPAAYEDYLTALGYMQRYDKPGNLDLAIAALQNSVKTDTHFALGYAQLGEVYRLKYRIDRDAKWLDEAGANCQKAVQLDSRMPAVYVTLGKIHGTTGKHDLALQEFQHALDIDPLNAAALSGLASAYEQSGRVADAEAAYQKAAALRPDDWDGHNSFGNFYDRQTKYPQAIAQYKRALQLTPDNAQVLLNLGGAYLDAGDARQYSAAEQTLKKSIELAPSYPAYSNLGNLYMVQQRYAEAAAAIEKALQLNDKDYQVWNNLLGTYQWMKEATKAEAVKKRMLPLVEKELRLKPQDATAQSTFAVLHAMNHEREKALEEIQTALALAPDDPQILGNTADVYELLGDRGHAMEYVEKALQKGLTLDQARTDPDIQALLKDPSFHPGKQ